MSKNLVKKVAVAGLAIFIGIPNIVGSINTYAAYNTEYQCENNLATIVSAVNQGQYTLLTDEYDEQGLVHTNQWNEYQLMLSQGSPKVVCVWTNGSSSGYYGIIAYQLEGQQKVTLPENAVIKVTDKYNLDHLSILKYLGNQLGSSYLFNVNDSIKKEEEKIKKEKAQIASEYAKQQAQAKADAEEIARNQEYNKQVAVSSNKNAVIPYTMDWLKNRAITVGKEISDRIYGEFDNKYDFVTKYAIAHYGSLEEMSKYNKEGYFDKDKHMGKEAGRIEVVNNILNDIKSGKATSVGDWIRKKFKENPMSSWNTLTYFVENTKEYDITVHGYRLITYKEEVQFNEEQCKYILEDMKVIANLSLVSKEEKTRMVENLMSGSTWIDGISTDDLSKQKMDNYKSSTQMKNELMNKWNTEYLPNIKE